MSDKKYLINLDILNGCQLEGFMSNRVLNPPVQLYQIFNLKLLLVLLQIRQQHHHCSIK
ncbi:unnamed protein product [Trichobilharzia regenti]|nr:unnamed protein product [Trichobilharzia regenti]